MKGLHIPRKEPERPEKRVQLSVSIPQDLKDQLLRDVCAVQGVSRFVEQAIREYLEKVNKTTVI
jgi:metal-responsive CopG/Arc/MetJ family transcriptional regulator